MFEEFSVSQDVPFMACVYRINSNSNSKFKPLNEQLTKKNVRRS
jgi:hypothetical protein